MTPRVLTVTVDPDWQSALRATALRSRTPFYQGEVLNFESPAMFFGRLTERRWAVLRELQAQGPSALPIRELARRVGRDVKRVHEDVQVLTELGLLEKDSKGAVACPFSEVHIDMHLKTAVEVA